MISNDVGNAGSPNFKEQVDKIVQGHKNNSPAWFAVEQPFIDGFLGAVPPIYFSGGFACGEPFDSNEQGIPTFFCFVNGWCKITTIKNAIEYAIADKEETNKKSARIRNGMEESIKTDLSTVRRYHAEGKITKEHAQELFIGIRKFSKELLYEVGKKSAQPA